MAGFANPAFMTITLTPHGLLLVSSYQLIYHYYQTTHNYQQQQEIE
jgi:hypothetical protein